MKNRMMLMILLFMGLAGFFMFKSNKEKMGTVIVLNGPSGSGKSSIQKEFQKLMMPNLWIKVGIDNLFDNSMPDITPENMNFWKAPNPIRWVETTSDQDDNNVVTLYVGKQGEKVAYGMNSAIAAYAHSGCNVIVDYIAYDSAWFADLKYKLKDVTAYYVAVQIPLDVLEQREVARATSPKGHARSHYDTVYGDEDYDLYVDSEKQSAEQIAKQLRLLLK